MISSIDERFMRLAIAKAQGGIEHGQSPFGACIVKDGQVISCEHNLVWAATDITAHAEVTAIRNACRALNTIDLSGCTIYSTCEPCPMCFSTCHWARIARIVFGARIEDAKRVGFSELSIPAIEMKRQGGSAVEVIGDCLRAENMALMEAWARQPDRRAY